MKNISYLLTLCFLVLASCGNVEYKKLKTGRPYAGFFQGRDCAAMIDRIEDRNVKGRIYFDEGNLVASPVSFTLELRKSGKGKLWILNRKTKLDKITIKADRIEGEVDKRGFSFILCQEEDLPFRAQYIEPSYNERIEKGILYAKNVKGYWASYPDTGEKFATIYANRASELTTKENLDLDLDIYCPKGSSKKEQHPLLLLIHGGAFYNGDKRDIGLQEMGRYLAKRGYVVASINYRLGFVPIAADVDRAGYRALQDAHAAVCYMLGKAKEYNIDTTKIFVAGNSAGAIAALNLAFMRDKDRPETTRKSGIRKWLSYPLTTGIRAVTSGARLIGLDLDFDADKVNKTLGLDSDLGSINAVSDSLSQPFRIKAVVNMWGAVQSLEILKNSRQTDILSFHGDADRIVPFGYGYPFNNVLESYVDSMIINLPKLIKPIAEIGRDLLDGGKSFNEWMFNPVYGSSLIHKKAKSLGMKSYLYKVDGGKHSLHLDANRALSPYFNDTIMPVMTRFLCEEMVGGKSVHLKQDGSWIKALGTDNVAELHWQVKGGIVLNHQDNNKVKVLLFGDAPHHSIKAGGKYRNGIEFKVSVPKVKTLLY